MLSALLPCPPYHLPNAGYRFTSAPFTPATRSGLLRSSSPTASAFLDTVLHAARLAYDDAGYWRGGSSGAWAAVAVPPVEAAAGAK